MDLIADWAAEPDAEPTYPAGIDGWVIETGREGDFVVFLPED